MLGNFSTGVGQGPTVLAVDEDGADCLFFLSSIISLFSLSLSLGWLVGCLVVLGLALLDSIQSISGRLPERGELSFSLSGTRPDID